MNRQFRSKSQLNVSVARRYFAASVLVYIFVLVSIGDVFAASEISDNKLSHSELPFGRLFTTPEQRASLDKLRKQGGLQISRLSLRNESEAPGPEQATNLAPQEIKLAGILWRADGKHKVWLTGTGTNSNRSILGDAMQSANLKVPIYGVNSGAILKPGQVWVSSNHRAEEAYRLAVPKSVAASSTPSEVTPVTNKTPLSSTSISEVQSSAQSSQK
jgi:hypothetical protein